MELSNPINLMELSNPINLMELSNPINLMELSNTSDSNWLEIKRCGYGSNFNKLYVHKNKKTIKKICFGESGMKKMKAEIYFYKNVDCQTFPKIQEYVEDGYIMEYLDGYTPLYQIYNKSLKKRVYELLENLHNTNSKIVEKEQYLRDLQIETEEKVLDRYNSSIHHLEAFQHISKVNGVSVLGIPEIIGILRRKIVEMLEEQKRKEYVYVPIHGDCQFNNILYCLETKEMKMIDPRGYFGTSLVYGMEEYDWAKVLFALSGYDEFDNRIIETLDMERDNIWIRLECLDFSIYDTLSLELLLMITIWCGNFSCFVHDSYKMFYSYSIARYLGTFVIRKFDL